MTSDSGPGTTAPSVAHPRQRVLATVENAGVWLLGHGSKIWPFIVLAVVGFLSWEAVRRIHPREFAVALHALDTRWLLVAAAATAVNIGAMGFYDVVAFRHTRSTWAERWRYGAVCFAWSNFLTLGPLAGPAMRFWLYRPAVAQLSDLHDGVVAVAVAFSSGLAGWTIAALLSLEAGLSPWIAAVLALAAAVAVVVVAQSVTARRRGHGSPMWQPAVLAVIGWSDWLLACLAFLACLEAAGTTVPARTLVPTFFIGQLVGVLSLVPGGFGSSDAYWVTHLPFAESRAAAMLIAYRAVYYIAPWTLASLLLLSWATRRARRRLEIARRIVAGLVGGGGVLIMISSASPALYARLPLLEQFIPLPLVEAGHLAAALAGLLLIVLARGLSRGYRVAFRLTLVLLTIAGCGAILKGFDWEEALVLGILFVATWSQAALFDRPSSGDWLEGPDMAIAVTALSLFILFGVVSHRVGTASMERALEMGYRLQAPRFLRTAGTLGLAVAAGAIYLLLRTPVRFRTPTADELARVLALHARMGSGTNPLMVAVGDKSAFVDGDRGFCLYRTIGPYVVVFSDPVVRSSSERTAFLDAFFAFAGELNRRPAFYRISLDWIPALHDRGYDFFKLGEEAQLPLDSVTLDGHDGKMLPADPPPRRTRRRPVPAPECRRGRPSPRHARTHLRRLAEDQRARRTPVLDRVFRPRLHDALPVRDRRGDRRAAPHPGLREPARGAAARRILRRSDAPHERGTEGDGLPVRLALPARQGARLRALQPRDGPARLGWRSARRTCERTAGPPALPARRAVVQTSRGCAPTRTNSTRSGCRATWPTRTPGNGRWPSPTSALSSPAAGPASSPHRTNRSHARTPTSPESNLHTHSSSGPVPGMTATDKPK
ncbi:MAG: phosphatidylglycerol lysyltransferase domain-containing protein [Vicinamibacterales bacterium]